ncbi:hypothetical protein J1N35_044783 [Gossypium stocksii]|uniref:Uncharacterized protein n=1 Tax=Gossypium stocksii TaxID=47602 RepID=A0A9D3UA15_9ROSI|nr:hypothetical protein J1N35_044783 [Gossypium stocksii]
METRVSGRKANDIIRRTSFDFSYKVEAKGFSEGIWLIWSEKLAIDVVEVSNLLIHCWNTSQGMKQSVFFIAVYASPKSMKQRTLRNHLALLAPQKECIGLDHKPLCLSTRIHEMPNKRRPFRFLTSWLEHEKFALVLNDSWTMDNDVIVNIYNFISTVKAWNCSSFGHIGRKKRVLMAKLKGIEEKLDRYPSNFLLNLEKQIRSELEEVLTQEASFWKQKA